jgi:uncharacterized protein
METNNMEEHHHLIPHWLTNTLGVLLIIFVAILIIQKGNDLKTTIKNQKPANTISVSAEGRLAATPDLATANFGVTSQGSSAKEVQSKNNDKINQIISYLKNQGVAKEDITTSQFYASPQYDYNNGRQDIIGYQTTQTVSVKIRGIDKSTDRLSAILGGITDNGANQFNGVSFSFDKPEDLQQQARKLAIDNAKKKAQDLAAQAGLSLGKVVSIAESGGGYPGPIPYATDSYGGNMAAPQMKAVAPTVEPGSQDITETMSVTFEVK